MLVAGRFVAAAAFMLMPFAALAQNVGVELVTDALDEPLFLTAPPGDPRLFIVEKTGLIRIVENGNLLPQPFLDLSAVVSTGTEQGLLGLAFHPRYASNGRFFVSFTDSADNSHIFEYRVSSDPNRAAPDTGRAILAIDRPTFRHNGGWIGFGPDGLLYATSGDDARTPLSSSQNLSSMMGKLFRIDVDRGGAPEIVAYGVRNAWRASFDGNTIWLGDVGQNNWEEINRFTPGRTPVNFGWGAMEGAFCFVEGACDPALYIPPVYAYAHSDGCSVTGGYVYRGSAVPALRGHYLFADWCTGFVRSIYGDGQVADWTPWLGGLGNITSFGIDARGELYLVVGGGLLFQRPGAVYRIVAR